MSLTPMTEEAARALHPTECNRNIRAMIPGPLDPVCPKCGARLCWGQRRGTFAKAHCVRGGKAALGLADCDWEGEIMFSFNPEKRPYVCAT